MENNLNCMDFSPKKRFRLEADAASRQMLWQHGVLDRFQPPGQFEKIVDVTRLAPHE